MTSPKFQATNRSQPSPRLVTGRSARPGQLRVGVLLPLSGRWRLFLQFRADGRIVTAPFTLTVK